MKSLQLFRIAELSQLLKNKSLPLSWGLLFALQASAQEKAFDEAEYRLSPLFGGPMNTIAGMTEWARDINHVYGVTTIVAVLVFLAVSIPLIITLYKFRVKEEDLTNLRPPKQIHGNALLEITWTIIPFILLLFIAVPTWQVIFKQPDEPPPGAMVVKVIGHQWWWEFQYPELGITTANELHLPAETPVFFVISSADVIHSFWIPQFGGKVDALPGTNVDNHLYYVTPALRNSDAVGGEVYQGQCVELCGLSHALMRFEAIVHKQDEFDRWAKTFNTAPVVASEPEKRGEMLFAQCQVCHTISGTASEDLEKQMLSMSPPVAKQGPNLTDFGNRRTLGAGTRKNTEENFIRWVKDPQSIKPGATMTPFDTLSDDELRSIAAYLRFSTAKKF
ncbi:MAG: cytochrome c oxidase subunit II [Deltaproteobacteria bacterium]|nr:cytochrome c oxidase subunit II [Deltaproteobacteria bacterium]